MSPLETINYGMTAQRDNTSQMRTYHEADLHELVQRCEPKHIHIPGDKDLPDCVRQGQLRRWCEKGRAYPEEVA